MNLFCALPENEGDPHFEGHLLGVPGRWVSFVALVCCVQSGELLNSGAQRCFARITRDFLIGGAVVRKCCSCEAFCTALVTDEVGPSALLTGIQLSLW